MSSNISKNSTTIEPKDTNAPKNSARRILSLWLPDWPIQRRVVDRPELRGRPVVIFQRDARGVRRVVAFSPRARSLGVRRDWPMSEVETLAAGEASGGARNRQLPQAIASDWIIEPHDAAADRRELENLADRCHWFSPLVGLEPDEEPDGLRLDVTGAAPWFGGEEILVRSLLEWLSRTGYWPRIAIADTLGMAWGVARWGSPHSSCRLLPDSHVTSTSLATQRSRRVRTAWTEVERGSEAVLGSRADRAVEGRRLEQLEDEMVCEAEEKPGKKPAAISPQAPPCWMVPVGDRAIFAALPVAALRIEPETTELLRQLGIERIHQLSSLPRDGLATRLGTKLIERIDQADGCREEPWNLFRALPELRCELDLEVPSADQEIVWSWLEEVVRRVTESLWKRRSGALRVDVRLSGITGLVAQWRVDLFRPTVDGQHLMGLLRLQTERCPPSAAVGRIEVEVPLSGPLELRQQELFDEGAVDRRAAGSLIESLTGRLGRERVTEVTLRDGAQPEFAFVSRPVAGSRHSRLARKHPRAPRVRFDPPVRRRSASSPTSQDDEASGSAGPNGASRLEPFRRPLRCWNPPLPLEVMTLADGDSLSTASSNLGSISHAPPQGLRLPIGPRRVVQHWGPERIETGWWRGVWVRRDYYVVETDDGHRYWIFRTRDPEGWFLHGAF